MSAYPEEYTRMLEVSDDFGFNLLHTERDLFDIDHCEAGAFLAREWNFPETLAVTIARHHEEPAANDLSIGNIIKLSWRLTDALGYAAFSPAKDWLFEDLLAYLPQAPDSWLCQSAEIARETIRVRLAASPL